MNDITTATYKTFLGFDVGKLEITVHDSSTGRVHVLENKAVHIRRFLKAYGLQTYAICEATGGYENRLLDCLLAANITAHRADARKIKAFIRSFGTLAKTDAIDARAIALYGRERHSRLVVWRVRNKNQIELQALSHHRADLVKTRAAEKNRLQAPGSKVVKPFCKKLIAHLDKQIIAIEREIARRIAGDQILTQTIEYLQTMSGVGPVTAQALCAFMPEIGTLTRRQAASLAGVAPHPKESGGSIGYRRVQGGRSHLKNCLFMAALTARRHNKEMRIFYDRLIGNGKKPIVAITAIMRKMIVILNARVRDQRIYQQS